MMMKTTLKLTTMTSMTSISINRNTNRALTDTVRYLVRVNWQTTYCRLLSTVLIKNGERSGLYIALLRCSNYLFRHAYSMHCAVYMVLSRSPYNPDSNNTKQPHS